MSWRRPYTYTEVDTAVNDLELVPLEDIGVEGTFIGAEAAGEVALGVGAEVAAAEGATALLGTPLAPLAALALAGLGAYELYEHFFSGNGSKTFKF